MTYNIRDVMRTLGRNYDLPNHNPAQNIPYKTLFVDTAKKIHKKFEEYHAADCGGCRVLAFEYAEQQGWITRKASVQPAVQPAPLENRVETPESLARRPDGFFGFGKNQTMDEYRRECDIAIQRGEKYN